MSQATLASDTLTDSNSISPVWTEIISSPLQRCRRFAEKLSESIDVPLSIEQDWQEIDYGDWDGMLLSQWRKSAAYQFREFKKDITALAPPNGEDFVSFSDRILSAWQKIVQKPDGSHILLVTHGGVMRVVIPTVLDLPLNKTGVLEIPFACLSRVKIAYQGERLHCSLVSHNAMPG
jgi:broad specificity phosphatase PhoE